ncbi:MAG: methyl-accepting chemotaxis protein [Haloferacaceae archaeon]|jgi:methyl-accepting chemotaxis protein
MAQSTGRGGIWGSYVTKFGLGVGIVGVLVAATAANLYTGLAPQLDAAAQQRLLSGLVSLLLVFAVGVGIVAATTGRESITSLRVLSDRAERMERGDLDVDLSTTKTDEVGRLYDAVDAMRSVIRTRIEDAERQNQRLQTNAADYSETMGAIADGDLSRRLDENVDEPVMATLAADFNDMMDQLERTVVDAAEFTDEVSAATERLATQTEAAMHASAQINDAAEHIAAENAGAQVDLDADLDVPAEDAPDVRADTEETLEAIEDLGGRMDRVDEITEFISDVATETNMLALNAGIEASKVEEGGAEGFQVVADEVKSLAEETRESADEIETISAEIRGSTNRTVESILRQQTSLFAQMNEQAEELAVASEDLRRTLDSLRTSPAVPSTEVATADGGQAEE